MPTNYKETTLDGTSWVRCVTVLVKNDYGTVPYILYDEERVINLLGANPIVQPIGTLRRNFDPDGVIPLINPQTGEATGATITQAEAYAVLYSAYLQAAMARDAEESYHE